MTIFLAGFVMIFLLGIQQQNITHENHLASVVTCLFLSAAQILLIQAAVSAGWVEVGLFWVGSALGSSLSIVVHKRFIRRGRRGVIGEPV